MGYRKLHYPSIAKTNADIYIIAVSDDAIDDGDCQYKTAKSSCSASVSRYFKTVTDHYGVFIHYKVYKEDADLPETPIFFDGSDEMTKKKLEALANSISPKHVTQASDDARSKLHVAAVFVNNFTNHLYALAENYCKKEGIDFNELLPLIEETALRIKDISSSRSQTGPAIRHDEETIEKHLAILNSHPELKKVYEFLTASIKGFKAMVYLLRG